jgi:hypothetical protein
MSLNAANLRLTVELLYEDLPFNTLKIWRPNLGLPHSLEPVTLQMHVNHHFWIDLFPAPSMQRMDEYEG